MKKIFTLFILPSFFITVVYGQQDAQFSQYMYNRLSFNPGYAGSSGAICATLIGRQQWLNFDGAPKTGVLSVDAPVKVLRGGLGLTLLSDQLGFDKTFYGKVAYAFKVPVGTSGNLGIGIEAGILNKSLSGAWKATDPWQNDPSIPANASDMTFDAGFGVYYHNPEFYVGISSTHLNAGELKEKVNNKQLNYKLARHYYVTAGYDYQLTPMFVLRSSLLTKTDVSSLQTDFNLNLLYNNTFWAGVSYRIADAIVPMAGFQKIINANSLLKIGYSYDITTSALNTRSSGSHEIMLGYCLSIAKKVIIINKYDVQKLGGRKIKKN